VLLLGVFECDEKRERFNQKTLRDVTVTTLASVKARLVPTSIRGERYGRINQSKTKEEDLFLPRPEMAEQCVLSLWYCFVLFVWLCDDWLWFPRRPLNFNEKTKKRN
jgi:hypothetical protein